MSFSDRTWRKWRDTHAIRVRLPLRRLQSQLSDLGHHGVEVIHDDGVHGVAGMFRLLDDEHGPVLSEFPHGLRVVGKNEGGEPSNLSYQASAAA
jgi:hypothetical protein